MVNRVDFVVATLVLISSYSCGMADEWPQWRGAQRDGVWTETGLIQEFDSAVIERKWSVPISSGYSGPTVSEGRVYVTDRVVQPKQIERVHCFDWVSGERLWSHAYDCVYRDISYEAGPRASVLIDEGRAYSFGAMGDLLCFDASDGTVLWQRDLNTDYRIRMPNWGIAASPLVYDELLIVQIGGEGACLVALDKVTGRERWHSLSDDASYSAPIVVEQAGRDVLVCRTGNSIVGLDPGSGRQHWNFDFPSEQWPITIATPVTYEGLLFVSEAHKGSVLLRLSNETLGVEKVWHRRKQEVADGAALHCLISTPYINSGYIYGADDRGILRCIKLSTGEQLWKDDTAVPENRWATIHLIRNADNTWLFNERGELIIARLSPAGYEELSRAKLLDPTTDQLRRRGGVTWSHPAFAYRHVFARSDKELVCADLSADPSQ